MLGKQAVKRSFYRKRRRESPFKLNPKMKPKVNSTPHIIGFFTDDENRVRPLTRPLPKAETGRPLKQPDWMSKPEWRLIQRVEYVGDDKFPSYRTNYIGSKQKIVPVILEETPSDVHTVFDAFGGSNVVAYNYKLQGKRVITNDRLKYSYHIAKAIVENNHITLSKKDVRMLLKPNQKHTFVYDNFKDTFFTPGICREIDSIRNNIDELKGYKRSLALSALGKTCLDSQAYGKFGVTKDAQCYGSSRSRQLVDTKSAFRKQFIKSVNFYNGLILDNEQQNKAYCIDVNHALKKVDADLVYFDPPYVTEFSTIGYEDAYHFVEGLMTHWRGKHLDHSTKAKLYKERAKALTKQTIYSFFESFIKNSQHINHALISYRNKAYPRGVEIKRLLEKHGKKIDKCRWVRHQYQISKEYTDASRAIEYLFIAS